MAMKPNKTVRKLGGAQVDRVLRAHPGNIAPWRKSGDLLGHHCLRSAIENE